MSQPNTTSKIRQCRWCHELRPIAPTRLKGRHVLYCSRCINRLPSSLKNRRVYANTKGNRRRIKVGGQHFGYAKTAEQAKAITRYGRERLSEFKSRFTRGAETKSDPHGAVAVETAVGDD